MKYFELQFYDNDSYLLDVSKVDRHKYITCPSCRMILNKRSLVEEHLPTYKIKRKKYHLSGSYDGFKMVSQNLKICMKYQIGKGLYSILYLKVKAFI